MRSIVTAPATPSSVHAAEDVVDECRAGVVRRRRHHDLVAAGTVRQQELTDVLRGGSARRIRRRVEVDAVPGLAADLDLRRVDHEPAALRVGLAGLRRELVEARRVSTDRLGLHRHDAEVPADERVLEAAAEEGRDP